LELFSSFGGRGGPSRNADCHEGKGRKRTGFGAPCGRPWGRQLESLEPLCPWLASCVSRGEKGTTIPAGSIEAMNVWAPMGRIKKNFVTGGSRRRSTEISLKKRKNPPKDETDARRRERKTLPSHSTVGRTPDPHLKRGNLRTTGPRPE